MKKLKRIDEPKSFFKGKQKVQFYKNLRDSKGKIRDRWNLIKYKYDIKKQLSKMSNQECSYCGKKIGKSNFDIEHYLPKEYFPYISYCFKNYLPTCKDCNQKYKRDLYPISLDKIRLKLGESILVDIIDNIIIFNKKDILEKTEDRIIDPSFDDIKKHIKFEPSSGCYKSITPIGKLTKDIFFKHREFVELLQLISKEVLRRIKKGDSKDEIMNLSKIMGYSFYFEEFYNYWKQFFV